MGKKILLLFILLVLFFTGCEFISYKEAVNPDKTSSVSSSTTPENEALINLKDGYTDKLSYFPGEKMKLYLNSEQSQKGSIGLYSINENLVSRTSVNLEPQKAVEKEAWKNGFGYVETTEFEIPNLKSGLYLWDKKIPFIIKTKTSDYDIVVVYPFNTINAYNTSGGKSLYDFNSDGARAYTVSFRRPMLSLDPEFGYCDDCGTNIFNESFLRWLNNSSYRVKMISDMDMDNYEEISSAKIIILAGHSEYWTRRARENFDRFVDNGGDGLILSGNTMYWQVRYSEDKTQLICYKNYDLDPVNSEKDKTVQWFRDYLEYPTLNSIGVNFAGYGVLKDRQGKEYDDGWNGFKILLPESPIFEGLNLKKGDIISVPTHEYDGVPVETLNDQGYPVLPENYLGFHKFELLGFDWAYDEITEKNLAATFIAFQKTPSSGKIINTASTNWASYSGFNGSDRNRVQAITRNMIDKLLNYKVIFTH